MKKITHPTVLLAGLFLLSSSSGFDHLVPPESDTDADLQGGIWEKQLNQKQEALKKENELIEKHAKCTQGLCKNGGKCRIRKHFLKYYKSTHKTEETKYLLSKLSARLFIPWLRSQLQKSPYKKWEVFCHCRFGWQDFATDCATTHPKAMCKMDTCKNGGRCIDTKFFYNLDMGSYSLNSIRKNWLKIHMIEPGRRNKYVCFCTKPYQPRTDCTVAYPEYENSPCFPNGFNASGPCKQGAECFLPWAKLPLPSDLEGYWGLADLSNRKYVCDCPPGYDHSTDCATECKPHFYGHGCLRQCFGCDDELCDRISGCKLCRKYWSKPPGCWKAKCTNKGKPLCKNNGICKQYNRKMITATTCQCPVQWRGIECHIWQNVSLEVQQEAAGASASADCGVCLDGAQCDLKTGECPAGCHQLFTTKFCNQTKPGATVMRVEIRGELLLNRVEAISQEEGEQLLEMLRNHLSSGVKGFTLTAPQFDVRSTGPVATGDLISLTRAGESRRTGLLSVQPRDVRRQAQENGESRKHSRYERQTSDTRELRVEFSATLNMESLISAAEARKTIVTAIRENAGNFNNDAGATIDKSSVEVTVVSIKRYESVAASTSNQNKTSNAISKPIIGASAGATLVALLALVLAFVMYRRRRRINTKTVSTTVQFVSGKKVTSSKNITKQ